MIQELQSVCPRFVRATCVGNARVITSLEPDGRCFITRVRIIGEARVYENRLRESAEHVHEIVVYKLENGLPLGESIYL
jgi:hypothetical protein